MKVLRRFAVAILLFLSACAPGVNKPAPTQNSPLLVLTDDLSSSSVENAVTPTLLPDEPPPARAKNEFKTDFSKHHVPYSEILSGGPPKDGIPALKDPSFVSITDANAWLKPKEPVILVQVAEDVRAYPIQILIWHEIANDTVGGEPLVVTFCPLCNTAIQIYTFLKYGQTYYSLAILISSQHPLRSVLRRLCQMPRLNFLTSR